MLAYSEMSKDELKKELEGLKKDYEEICKKNISLDMSRGKPGKEQLEALDGVLEDFGGRKQIIEDDCCIIEVTATPATINFFVEELREYHIKEVCRTGGAALALSQETVY